MTKKRAPSLSKEERIRLWAIKARHGNAESIEQWVSCDASLKDQVIGELEGNVLGAEKTEFVKALELAIAVLDTAGVAGALGTDAQTQSDIRWLLERVVDQKDS